MATLSQQRKALLEAARKTEIDPTSIEPVLQNAEGFDEIRHPNAYRWYLIRRFPIDLLDPPSRESYEGDLEIDDDEVQQNLDRYDDLVQILIRGGAKPWPVIVDRNGLVIDGYHRLAVLADYGHEYADVVQAIPR